MQTQNYVIINKQLNTKELYFFDEHKYEELRKRAIDIM